LPPLCIAFQPREQRHYANCLTTVFSYVKETTEDHVDVTPQSLTVRSILAEPGYVPQDRVSSTVTWWTLEWTRNECREIRLLGHDSFNNS